MKRSPWMAAPLLLVTACSPGQTAPEPHPAGEALPGKSYVLPAAMVPAMLSQCSRDAPTADSGQYQPSSADIARIEALLPAALAAHAARGAPTLTGSGAVTMDRQYVGLKIAGRPSVYGNFYLAPDYAPRPGNTFDPARDPNVVCDGGPSFFGVVYDVGRDAITRVDFNGPY